MAEHLSTPAIMTQQSASVPCSTLPFVLARLVFGTCLLPLRFLKRDYYSIMSLESNWPGEREPSRHDVEAANHLPEPAFFTEFKRHLVSSPEALNNEDLMHLDLRVCDYIFSPNVNDLNLIPYRTPYLGNIRTL